MQNLKLWAHGLGAAFVGGAVTTLAGVVITPQLLSSLAGLKQLGVVAVAAGATSALAYLVKSPIPGLIGDVQTPGQPS